MLLRGVNYYLKESSIMMNKMNNANTNESANVASFIYEKLNQYFNNIDRVETKDVAPHNKNCTSVPQTYAELKTAVDDAKTTNFNNNYIVVKVFNDDKKEEVVKTYGQEQFCHRLMESGDKVPVIKSLYQIDLITAINLAKEVVKLTNNNNVKEYFGHVLIDEAKLKKINSKIRMIDDNTFIEFGGVVKKYIDILSYIGDNKNCIVDTNAVKTINMNMMKFVNICESILRNEKLPHKFYFVYLNKEGVVSRAYVVPAKQVRNLLDLEGAYPEYITMTDKDIKFELQLMTSANTLMIEGDDCVIQSLKGAVLRLLTDYFYSNK
jgi:hypothetical protein